jgi:hypothetical protein
MELIEQAVFMSAASEGDRRVVTSPGVCEADAREILAWGPTEEGLLAGGEEPGGLHFHPLPSGAYTIGRTTGIARRPGMRGGLPASTHCLVVRPRALARFAGNPFALVRAAQAAGMLRAYEELPARLDAFRLDGRAAVVDTALLAQLSLRPGPDWMAALVQAAIDSVSTAIVDGAQVEDVVAGVINCLPPECRMEMSFSIGLRFCARRPYRLVALPSGTDETQRMERLYNVAILDLAGDPPEQITPIGSWGGLIHRVLKSGRASFFAGQLARRPLDFSPQDLPALGLQMLEELDASAFNDEGDNAEHAADDPLVDERWEAQAEAGNAEENDRVWPVEPEPEPSTFRGSRRHAHASHPSRPSNAELPAAAHSRPSPPSKALDPNSPEVLEKLERLDDLVFDAISGNQASLGELKVFWPKVRNELEDPLLAESREQYLRYALMSWEELAQRDTVRNPSLAMQSLEVLCVLFSGTAD